MDGTGTSAHDLVMQQRRQRELESDLNEGTCFVFVIFWS